MTRGQISSPRIIIGDEICCLRHRCRWSNLRKRNLACVVSYEKLRKEDSYNPCNLDSHDFFTGSVIPFDSDPDLVASVSVLLFPISSPFIFDDLFYFDAIAVANELYDSTRD